MRTELNGSVIAILLAAQAASCHNTAERTRTAGEPTAAPSAAQSTLPQGELSQQTATTQTRMKEHFSKATDAKTAVMRGDLERARSAASSLAASEWTSNLRPDWRPYMGAMQDAARSVARAADTTEAAQGIGRMGKACAACHLAVGGPKFIVKGPPDADAKAEFQPKRHVWGVDRMWEGLIGPSDEAWRRGAAELVAAPLQPAVRIATREVPAEITVLSNKVHDLGRRAEMVDADRRGAALGDVIATCATCHQRLEITLPE